MPETIDYDPVRQRLLIGAGYAERVTPAVWSYEVSGKKVLCQWFSYRWKCRKRPVMGDRRPPSKLEEIQAEHWLAEYTTDLIDLLNVLGLLVEMEPQQADLLKRACAGKLLTVTQLNDADALVVPVQRKLKRPSPTQQTFVNGFDSGPD